MKKILFLFLLGMFMSCNSNQKLEGTWIGAYSYSHISDSDTHLPQRIVVTFKNGQYFARSFKYDYRAESDLENGSYEYRGDSLFLKSSSVKTEIIDILSKDSLVIKGLGGSSNTVYKKLDDSLKSRSGNISLTGKRFLRTSKNYSDTLNFVNDSVVVKSWGNSRNLELSWERINHNGFDILFMDLDIPYIIRMERNGVIKLTGLHKKRYDLELKELE